MTINLIARFKMTQQ